MITLTLLIVKHWYFDFYRQTEAELQFKGTYGHPKGITHSLKHGAATALVFAATTLNPLTLITGAIDAVLHYHIDYAKMRFGNQDASTKQFWNHIGLDQLAHNLTYVALVAIAA